MRLTTSLLFSFFLCVMLATMPVAGQENVSVVAQSQEAAENLDLQAVAELFRESKDLEAFEKALNDPKVGVNNLDLDENQQVDYIRVVEQSSGEAHVVILQALLSATDSQDVATIEVDEASEGSYQLQVRGDPVVYGPNYYVAPTPIVRVHLWPIVGWMYGPVYRPYRSVFYFGYYPRYYRPWRPVTLHVYRGRTVHYRTRTNFTVVRTSRVTSVRKVGYTPSSSRLVKKRAVTTTATSGSGVQTNVSKVGRQKTNLETGRTVTTKAGQRQVTNPNTGNTRTSQGVSRTVTNPNTGRSTNVKAGRTKVTNPETGKTRVTKGVSGTKVNSKTGTRTKASAGKVKGSKVKTTKVKKTKVKKTKAKKPRKRPRES